MNNTVWDPVLKVFFLLNFVLVGPVNSVQDSLFFSKT